MNCGTFNDNEIDPKMVQWRLTWEIQRNECKTGYELGIWHRTWAVIGDVSQERTGRIVRVRSAHIYQKRQFRFGGSSTTKLQTKMASQANRGVPLSTVSPVVQRRNQFLKSARVFLPERHVIPGIPHPPCVEQPTELFCAEFRIIANAELCHPVKMMIYPFMCVQRTSRGRFAFAFIREKHCLFYAFWRTDKDCR